MLRGTFEDATGDLDRATRNERAMRSREARGRVPSDPIRNGPGRTGPESGARSRTGSPRRCPACPVGFIRAGDYSSDQYFA